MRTFRLTATLAAGLAVATAPWVHAGPTGAPQISSTCAGKPMESVQPGLDIKSVTLSTTGRTSLRVVRPKRVTVYTPYKEWVQVMFIHPKTGEDTMGWMLDSRLKTTGTMGPR